MRAAPTTERLPHMSYWPRPGANDGHYAFPIYVLSRWSGLN